MKITCISDTHEKHEQIETGEGDVLIHSGDFTNIGHPDKVYDFLSWFSQQKYHHRILVAGNHDLSCQPGHQFHEVWLDAIDTYENHITYLMNSDTVIDGVKFYGSPYTPPFYDWAFMKGEKDLGKMYGEFIAKDTDVIISHGPPLGYLDVNSRGYNCGSQALKQIVKKIKPQLVVFGHIHPGHGIHLDGPTCYVNAAQLNERHEVIYKPITINI